MQSILDITAKKEEIRWTCSISASRFGCHYIASHRSFASRHFICVRTEKTAILPLQFGVIQADIVAFLIAHAHISFHLSQPTSRFDCHPPMQLALAKTQPTDPKRARPFICRSCSSAATVCVWAMGVHCGQNAERQTKVSEAKNEMLWFHFSVSFLLSTEFYCY